MTTIQKDRRLEKEKLSAPEGKAVSAVRFDKAGQPKIVERREPTAKELEG